MQKQLIFHEKPMLVKLSPSAVEQRAEPGKKNTKQVRGQAQLASC